MAREGGEMIREYLEENPMANIYTANNHPRRMAYRILCSSVPSGTAWTNEVAKLCL